MEMKFIKMVENKLDVDYIPTDISIDKATKIKIQTENLIEKDKPVLFSLDTTNETTFVNTLDIIQKLLTNKSIKIKDGGITLY